MGMHHKKELIGWNNMANLSVWGKTLKVDSENKGEKNNFTQEDVYYPVLAHMLDSATTMGILYDNWLNENIKKAITEAFNKDEQLARKAAMFIAGIHDLGKISPIFQGALLHPTPNQHKGKVEELTSQGLPFPSLEDYDIDTLRQGKLQRHEKIGYWLLANGEKDLQNKISENWIQEVVLAHHGLFEISYGNPRTNSQMRFFQETMTKAWKDEAFAHVEELEKSVSILLEDLKKYEIPHEIVILLSGLVILADRLASNEKSVIKAHEQLICGELDLRKPEEYINKREEFLTKLAEKEIGFSKSLSEKSILGDFAPRGVQNLVPEERGLWLVMAPTGAGKTEAALLRHTKAKENLIFLLPTRSTTDAMFSRVQKIYSSIDGASVATLAHGDAYLSDFYSRKHGVNPDHEHCGPGLIPSGFTNAGAKLSAPITIGTIDQMVMGGLPLKWSHLRLLTLANSHIIIDEAHLIDPYQMTLIKDLLGFLGKLNTKVTILSATLPKNLKDALVKSYTLNSEYDELALFPSQEIQPSHHMEEFEAEPYAIAIKLHETNNFIGDVEKWAIDKLSESPKARLGIFVNTVDKCVNAAKAIQTSIPDATVICLHSRMMGKHRKEVVENLLKLCGTQNGKAERVILVGTQVIEMSLDIDLDLIATEICPAPNFIQRGGRAWRDKSSEAFKKRYGRISQTTYPNLPIDIFWSLPQNEKDKPNLPYLESAIKRTIDFLENRAIIQFPSEVQEFVETSTFGLFNDNEKISIRESEEISVNIYKELKASAIRSKIMEFINPYTTVAEGAILTNSTLGEEVATRLIEGDHPPIIILSDDVELQKLGALPTNADATQVSEILLKSASVGVSNKIANILKKNSIEPLKIGNRSFVYYTELPSELYYSKFFGFGVK